MLRLAAAAMLISPTVAAAQQEAKSQEQKVASQTPATQAPLDKRHPDYVRCKTEPVLGSRAKRTRTCKTNREWAILAQQGHRDAVELIGQPRIGGNSN